MFNCSKYGDFQLIHSLLARSSLFFLSTPLPSSMKKNRRRPKRRSGSTFDPQDQSLVEHRKLGVWDLYVERDPNLSYFPTSWRVEKYTGLFNDLPYLSRTIRDVGAVAWPLLFLYVAITLVKSLSPALNLWYVDDFCLSSSA
jgi:hypothetical protein